MLRRIILVVAERLVAVVPAGCRLKIEEVAVTPSSETSSAKAEAVPIRRRRSSENIPTAVPRLKRKTFGLQSGSACTYSG